MLDRIFLHIFEERMYFLEFKAQSQDKDFQEETFCYRLREALLTPTDSYTPKHDGRRGYIQEFKIKNFVRSLVVNMLDSKILFFEYFDKNLSTRKTVFRQQ